MNSTEKQRESQLEMNQNLVRELVRSQKLLREIQHRMREESAKIKGELDLLCQLYRLPLLDIPASRAYLSLASDSRSAPLNGG